MKNRFYFQGNISVTIGNRLKRLRNGYFIYHFLLANKMAVDLCIKRIKTVAFLFSFFFPLPPAPAKYSARA